MSRSNVPGHPPPGWYKDPRGLANWRFWDGQTWTEHVVDGAHPEQTTADARPDSASTGAGTATARASQTDAGHDPTGRDHLSRTQEQPAAMFTQAGQHGHRRFGRIPLDPSTRKGQLTLAGVGIVVVGALIIAIFATAGDRTLEGNLTLMDMHFGFDVNEPTCEGRRGYSDIRGGALVTLHDQTGQIIATGNLDEGRPGPPNYTQTASRECRFSFVLLDVPTSDFYSIRIANRGGLTFSYSQLEAQNWRIDASLGP
jgi:hypothetical protein